MDFTARTGSTIYATGDGVVARADNTASGFGKSCRNQARFWIRNLVCASQPIQMQGRTTNKTWGHNWLCGKHGRSEGPHLHYEVHKNGKVVNPLNFYYGNISAVEYVAIAQAANQENQSFD